MNKETVEAWLEKKAENLPEVKFESENEAYKRQWIHTEDALLAVKRAREEEREKSIVKCQEVLGLDRFADETIEKAIRKDEREKTAREIFEAIGTDGIGCMRLKELKQRFLEAGK